MNQVGFWIASILIAGLLMATLLLGKVGRGRSGEEAHALVDQGAVLVDVRTKQEFAAGHLPGAINIPVQDLEVRVTELGSKHVPMVVYCKSGSRSSYAAGVLERAGYERVLDLGPMSAW
jgi:rhodanese-related sulfurtransferase